VASWSDKQTEQRGCIVCNGIVAVSYDRDSQGILGLLSALWEIVFFVIVFTNLEN